MSLITLEDKNEIAKYYEADGVINWQFNRITDQLLGYLGDHFKVVVNILRGSSEAQIKLFMKTMPFDLQQAAYIKSLKFFDREYVMLSKLLKEFGGDEGPKKWRPKPLIIRRNIFVFEDVTELGYRMPSNLKTMTYDDLILVVKSMARMHAKSYIYEEKRSMKLNRPYRISEDFSQYLSESASGDNWRNAGMNFVIEFLKTFSKHRHQIGYAEKLYSKVPKLFIRAKKLMYASENIRNCVVHRDLWSNNIFLRKLDGHNGDALLIDFQTALYASPGIDLSALLYFNTTRKFREENLSNVTDLYYNRLSQEMDEEIKDSPRVLKKSDFIADYKVSCLFGITQAALINPITSLTTEDRDRIFCDPKNYHRVNEISRSEELLEVAHKDLRYRNHVMDLFAEIEDNYIFTNAP